MRSTTARAIALTLTITMSDLAQAQTSAWSLCGAGSYTLTAGGQTIGNETFEVTCKPDGKYSATGRTQLTPLGLDLTTALELDAKLQPISASAKGTVQGKPFDQSGTYANGTATLTSNGQSQTISYTPNASWSGGNIFYTNAFIAARYDEAKGGAQQVPIFPTIAGTLERLGTDAPSTNGETATFTRFALRLGGQEILLWRDAQRRLAVIAVPAQRFAATRPEQAKWTAALLDLARTAPAQGASASQPAPSIDYSAPPGAAYTAEEVTIPVATYKLAGTLLTPKTGKSPHAAAVMITGSGLQTRDSRIALPGLEQYAPFKQIAERLASSGVAVLRVDDRGIGGSTGRETLATATTTSLAEDTRAQIAWLRARPGIDPKRIIVIGHSEGATIASMIAASDPAVAAVVLMAGVAKRGADVSFEQQEDLLKSDTTMDEATKTSMREKQKDAAKAILEGREIPGQPVVPWIREYFAYDPLPTIRKVKQPVLILQGERDRQVDRSHAAMLERALRDAGNTHVKVIVFPTLNHLFLPSKTGSFNEYSHLETSAVPSAVLDAIATWVTALE
jgi:dipeptidyl aminopeptidase/acylaminoacyl peptidase